MITVYHLNNSRSQRILWLLEELDLKYQIEHFQRDPKTNLAPAELEAIHPLGKAPMLRSGDTLLIESGAIVDYLVRRHGGGRLAPVPGSDDHEQYLQWLHYAEGSAMLPLMLKLYTGRLPDGGEALQPRITGELDNHLGYMNGALEQRDWFVGNSFSAADVQLSFPVEVARRLYSLSSFPNLETFLQRIHARPAYQKALERGGDYDYGG